MITRPSHLPKVRSFPAISSHLPKVSFHATPSRTSVSTFPFHSDLFHLPKVRSFPAISSHLPKVSFHATPSRTSVSTFPFHSDHFHLPKVRSFPAISSHLPKVSTLALLGKSGNGRTPRRCNRLKINAQQHNEVLSSLKNLLVSTRWFRNALTIT